MPPIPTPFRVPEVVHCKTLGKQRPNPQKNLRLIDHGLNADVIEAGRDEKCNVVGSGSSPVMINLWNSRCRDRGPIASLRIETDPHPFDGPGTLYIPLTQSPKSVHYGLFCGSFHRKSSRGFRRGNAHIVKLGVPHLTLRNVNADQCCPFATEPTSRYNNLKTVFQKRV